MKTRTMIIDPTTTFEPRAAVKRAWLSTRKRPITLGSRDSSITHPGCFDTDNVASDVFWFFLALTLEIYSVWQLRAVGAFENLVALAGFVLLDLLLAGFAHSGTAAWQEYYINRNRARSPDEKNWASIFKPAIWRRVLSWIGMTGLATSALVKAGFFIERADPTIALVAVPVAYAFVAFLHIRKTGYLGAHVFFRLLLALNWRRYCRGDSDLRFTEARRLSFKPTAKLRKVAVNQQELVENGNGDWVLLVRGTLQDDEAMDLATQQETPEAQAEVLCACLDFQATQIALNPNQEIVAVPHSSQAALVAVAPLLLAMTSMIFVSCAKPKEKAASINTVDIVVVAPEPKNNELSAELLELLSPFITPEGTALIPNVKLLFRRDADQAICEASIVVNQKDLKPSILSRLFGSSGLPVEQIIKTWAEQAKKPLVIRELDKPTSASTLPSSDKQLLQETIAKTGSRNLFALRCGDLAAMGVTAEPIRDRNHFRELATRGAAQTWAAKGQAMVILHEFKAHDVAVAVQKPEPEPPPPSEGEVPPTVEGEEGETAVKSERELVPVTGGTTVIVNPANGEKPAIVVQRPETAQRIGEPILFEVNSAKLSRRAWEIIDEIAAQLKRTRQHRVILEAGADASGGERANVDLATYRGRAVQAALLARGIVVESLLSIGESHAPDEANRQERSQFRAVHVFTIDPPTTAAR